MKILFVKFMLEFFGLAFPVFRFVNNLLCFEDVVTFRLVFVGKFQNRFGIGNVTVEGIKSETVFFRYGATPIGNAPCSYAVYVEQFHRCGFCFIIMRIANPEVLSVGSLWIKGVDDIQPVVGH
ncbi:MAG TPA: hypothetical protein P5084_00565 [Paludibacter sp.]|nr:hypothetical protein [Paludibacter sp.]